MEQREFDISSFACQARTDFPPILGKANFLGPQSRPATSDIKELVLNWLTVFGGLTRLANIR
jgi:hypothetical protein